MKLKIQYLWWIEDKISWISLTGSSTLFSLSKKWKEIYNILVDAGSFQGSKNIEQLDRINHIDPKKLDVIIATHAHLDHIWRIPYLVKNWFEWDIYMTDITKRLAYENWMDSISIKKQEIKKIKNWKKRIWSKLRTALSIVKQLWMLENNKHLKKKDKEKIKENLNKAKIDIKKAKNLLERYWIKSEPDVKKLLSKRHYTELLFNEEDVERTIKLIKTIKPEEETMLLKNLIYLKPYNAAHIEWSISVLLKFKNWNKKTSYNCLIAQDLWRFNWNPINETPLIPNEKINYIQIEQTYATRNHEKIKKSIAKFIEELLNHKWPILIPAFSIQRSQFILRLILENYNKLWRPNIYIDSKLMQKVNEIFAQELPEKYAYLNSKLIKPVLANTPKNKILADNTILISSSWMAQWWSIEKWLKPYLENVNAKIIFVWYQAEWTNWRKILNGEDILVWWEKIKVLCDKVYIEGFSSHADDKDLKSFLKKLRKNEKVAIALVHWWDTRFKFKEELIKIFNQNNKLIWKKKKGNKQKIDNKKIDIIIPTKIWDIFTSNI